MKQHIFMTTWTSTVSYWGHPGNRSLHDLQPWDPHGGYIYIYTWSDKTMFHFLLIKTVSPHLFQAGRWLSLLRMMKNGFLRVATSWHLGSFNGHSEPHTCINWRDICISISSTYPHLHMTKAGCAPLRWCDWLWTSSRTLETDFRGSEKDYHELI